MAQHGATRGRGPSLAAARCPSRAAWSPATRRGGPRRETGPPGEVGDRAPGLARRAPCSRCPGAARRSGCRAKWSTLQPCACGGSGVVGRAFHPERRQQPGAYHLPPGRAAQPGDHLAEQREAEVGVVEPLPRAGDGAEPSLASTRVAKSTPGDAPTRSRPARSACPRCATAAHAAVAARTASPAGSVRSGHRARAALVAQLEHRDGGDGLGDRADPVLRADRSALTPPVQASSPSRTTPATTDGSRPVACRCSQPELPGRRDVTRRRPPAAGRRRPGCGRRRPGRSGRRAASTCRGRCRSGRPPARASRRGPTRRPARARCAALRAAASSPASTPPRATRSISALIAIIASQNRSISARSSDSVGSTISVPATGNDMVGAWKP